MATEIPVSDPQSSGVEWWRTAVIYQVYPRSFADADGDGVGDLPGVIAKLDYLADLGIDAIWLSPFYPSPQNDAGYDISDFCDVDPTFGTLDDFRALLVQAHMRDLKVIVDIVPNHSSDQHPWFRAALEAGPGSGERARYVFRHGRGERGELPPNNWQSVFAGPAWTPVPDEPGQWYLNYFDSTQPDFNWENADVHRMFDETLRFWLDLGVDGFRIDVARGMVKPSGLPDYPPAWQHLSGDAPDGTRSPMWDNEGIHEVFRGWREIVDSYPGDRILVAEAYVEPVRRLARYVRADELHQAFNFQYLRTVTAEEIRHVVEESLAEYGAVGAPSTWVLNNHDNVRHVSRLGWVDPYIRNGVGIGPSDPQPDNEIGLIRARALTAVMLALPGSAYLYQGEELGLPEHTLLKGEDRQDPTWRRSDGEIVGRDGARVPLPWNSAMPAFGFSSTGRSWLPQPTEWARFAVDTQMTDSQSTLNFYRAALRLRSEHHLGEGSIVWDPAAERDILHFRVGPVEVLANLSDIEIVGSGREMLLSSAPMTGKTLPPHTVAWYRCGPE